MWKQFKYFVPFLDVGNSRVFCLFSFFACRCSSSISHIILWFLFVLLWIFHPKKWFYSVVFFVCVIKTKSKWTKNKRKRMEIGKVHTWKSLFKWICKVFQLMFMFVTQSKDVSIDVEDTTILILFVSFFFISLPFTDFCLWNWRQDSWENEEVSNNWNKEHQV